MGRYRYLGLLALGAALLLLPGGARAEDESRTYRFPLPAGSITSTLDWSVAYPAAGGSIQANGGTAALGDWVVTVGVDPEHCEILCVYRRVRNETHLMPPVAEIRLHTGSGMLPVTLTVDPAGTRFPMLFARARVTADEVYLPARRAFGAILVHHDDHPVEQSSLLPVPSFAAPADLTTPSAAPLRI